MSAPAGCQQERKPIKRTREAHQAHEECAEGPNPLSIVCGRARDHQVPAEQVVITRHGRPAGISWGSLRKTTGSTTSSKSVHVFSDGSSARERACAAAGASSSRTPPQPRSGEQSDDPEHRAVARRTWPASASCANADQRRGTQIAVSRDAASPPHSFAPKQYTVPFDSSAVQRRGPSGRKTRRDAVRQPSARRLGHLPAPRRGQRRLAGGDLGRRAA